MFLLDIVSPYGLTVGWHSDEDLLCFRWSDDMTDHIQVVHLYFTVRSVQVADPIYQAGVIYPR